MLQARHSNTQSLPKEKWQWMPEVEDLKREAVVEPWSVSLIVPFSSFNASCDQCGTPVMDTFHWARHQRAHNPPNSAALHQTPGRRASQWFYLPGPQRFLRSEAHLTNSHKIFVFVVFLCETRRSLATTWIEFDVTLMKHDLLRALWGEVVVGAVGVMIAVLLGCQVAVLISIACVQMDDNSKNKACDDDPALILCWFICSF